MTRERAFPLALVVLAVLVLLALSGCETLGLEAPVTPEQKVLAAYATATAVNQSATLLLNQKKISSSDAQNVLDSTRAARKGIDVARSLAAIDSKSATAKLQTQQEILRALQNYLKEKGG